MLHGNLKRCGLLESGVQVLNRDPAHLTLPQSPEVIIVDAPCSGQSLLAKGEKNPGCFHPAQINKNANRQKRILATVAPLLAPGGYLAYMTCTYSLEENEKVLEWFLQRFTAFTAIPIPLLNSHRSPHTPHPCYRLFPHEGIGAGAFTALLRIKN
jgi:16S rRNA C967 or C1407 C5-methylase (RsmB/RsmF family)